MESPTSRLSLGKIIVVADDRISRQKSAILTRNLNALRHFAEVQVTKGDISEAELITKLQAQPIQLVLAPWYRYLAWSKVEAFYGLTRSSGPTFAGYHCEQILPYELGEQADHLRAILLDLSTTHPKEVATLVRALIQDTKRSGIRPLLDPNTPVYFENWQQSQGLGSRLDAIMQLPGINGTEWSTRFNALRICMSALWSLIYEQGPGKSEFAQGVSAKAPRAAFQIGADASTLVLRLCYSMPSWTPKNVLAEFWPDPKRPTAPSQLLLKFADLIRVHLINEANDVEIVAAFYRSALSERSHGSLQTLWVEPLAPNMVSEIPFETNETNPSLKPLPVSLPATDSSGRGRAEQEAAMAAEIKAKERFIFESAVKLRELRAQLKEREDQIKELRSGGVGTAQPLPPPDAESLLEALQERFSEARYQIREFEHQISDLEKNGATVQEIESLRKKMSVLTAREQSWILKVARSIEAYRQSRSKPPGSATG